MALFAAAARRAATSSLPMLRASVSRGGLALLQPLAAAAARPMPFSSVAGMKPSSDDELPRVIKAESKLAVQYDDDNLVDEDGSVFYSDGSLSSSDESSPSADDSSSSSVRIQEDQGENHPKEDSIHTTCISQMNDDSSVKFSCTIYPTERKIVIDALALRPPPSFYELSDEDDDIIETVDGCFTESEEVVEFRKLDVKLQHALYKLVEPMRYYTPEITELFQENIMSKDRPGFSSGRPSCGISSTNMNRWNRLSPHRSPLSKSLTRGWKRCPATRSSAWPVLRSNSPRTAATATGIRMTKRT